MENICLIFDINCVMIQQEPYGEVMRVNAWLEMVEKRAKSDKMKTQMVHNNFFQKGDMVVNGKGSSLEKGGYLTLF